MRRQKTPTRTVLRMRQVRRSRELTLAQVAELADLPIATVSRAERGSDIRLDTARKIAKALNEADVASLFDYVEVPAS